MENLKEMVCNACGCFWSAQPKKELLEEQKKHVCIVYKPTFYIASEVR
jgi:hypothetical protein